VQRPSASSLAGDTLLVNARVGRVHEGRYAVVLAHRCLKCPACMQEEYVKKRKEKHTVRAMRAVVQRPTLPSIAEALFSWKPE